MSTAVVYTISSIVVWGIVLVIAMRVLAYAGCALPKGKFTDFVLSDENKLKAAYEPTSKELARIFCYAFAFRIAVFVISVFIIHIFRENVHGFSGILEEYDKWDSTRYSDMIEGGYTNLKDGDEDYVTLAFFPLFSWLGRIVNVIVHQSKLSGILTSSLLYSGACCYMYRLFTADHDKDTAARAIVYISVSPFAFYFGTIMTESTLLFTSAATLYYIRKHDWKMVGIFGMLASLSRMAGLLLAIPAAVEWLEEYKIFEKLRKKDIKSVWKLFYSKGLWIFLMLMGLVIYLFCNWKITGDPFKFLEYQRKYWYHGSAYFGTGLNLVYQRIFNGDGSLLFDMWIPSGISVLFIVGSIVYGIRKNRNMYAAYAIAYFILNVSFDWVISIPRYMLCDIPAFLFLAQFTQRHKKTEPFIIAVMAISFGIYMTAWLCYKQIL